MKLNQKKGNVVMTKTIRIKIEDAFIFEQASRELAAELQKEVRVSDLLNELTKDVERAKERIKKKIIEASKI